ncbi:MAG TPA: hypothetical protein VFA18_25550 [Gemmataceae bacterium]|nr:hypothetical protein [Gemmataceae bacterium]
MRRFRPFACACCVACLLALAAGRVCAHDDVPADVVRVPTVNLKDRGIEDRAPVRSKSENGMEFNAYYDAVVTAHGATAAGFAKGARRDVSYVNVFEQPERYRGDILHIEGRLYRVRKLEAASFVHDLGIDTIYEGWVYTDADGNRYPWCIVFTDLPSGLQIGESMNVQVAFDGFFFKRYRYQARSGKTRDCPLLIGHSPVVTQPLTATRSNWPTLVIVGLAGLLGTTIALIVALTWWYGRSDRHLRARLAVTGSTFAEPGSREEEPEGFLRTSEDEPSWLEG